MILHKKQRKYGEEGRGRGKENSREQRFPDMHQVQLPRPLGCFSKIQTEVEVKSPVNQEAVVRVLLRQLPCTPSQIVAASQDHLWKTIRNLLYNPDKTPECQPFSTCTCSLEVIHPCVTPKYLKLNH